MIVAGGDKGLGRVKVWALALLLGALAVPAQAETITSVTQYAYDTLGRPSCTTVRMNQATFGLPPADACTPGTPGADGPDRITRVTYDEFDQVTQVASGYGTSAPYAPRVEKTATYTLNGNELTVADGKGNTTTYEYDDLDRLAKVRYPSSTCCASSQSDYDTYTYDATDNRIGGQRRGVQLAFTYDALNRVQNGIRGEVYAYDNLSHITSATYAGVVASATYDALGQMRSETVNGVTLNYLYDQAGNRGRITWPDGFIADYGYLPTNELAGIYENGGSIVAAYGYDDMGRRTIDWAGPGTPVTVQGYYYDAASRLNGLGHWPSWQVNSADDHSWSLSYNAASQVKSRTISNGAYDWSGTQASKAYTANGLNQMTSAGGTAITYSARGNLEYDGSRTYCYDALNNLTSVWAGSVGCNPLPTGTPVAALTYDPTGRLWKLTANGTTTTFLYAGSSLVAELNAQGAVVRRYLPGPGVDEYPVWYEGAGISNRRYLMRDLQGSVSMVASGGGAAPTTNTYDEYGIPAAGNAGRVQYTGQLWLPEVGLYHYKARAYSPTLGRFLQTDPIGYANSMNWYAYVGNDPLNRSDPTGLAMIATTTCARYSAAGPGVSGGYCKTTYEQFGEDSDKSRGQPPPPPPQPRPQDTAACAISRKYAKAAAEAQLAANGLQLAGLAVAGYGLTEGGKGISPLTRGAAKILEFYSVAPEIGGFADSVIAGTAAAYATKDPAALGSAVALFIVTQGSAAKFEGTLGMSYGAARLLIGKGADEAADRLTPNGCKKKK